MTPREQLIFRGSRGSSGTKGDGGLDGGLDGVVDGGGGFDGVGTANTSEKASV